MWVMWRSTGDIAITSCAAISRVVQPPATRRKTSTSVAVRRAEYLDGARTSTDSASDTAVSSDIARPSDQAVANVVSPSLRRARWTASLNTDSVMGIGSV